MTICDNMPLAIWQHHVTKSCASTSIDRMKSLVLFQHNMWNELSILKLYLDSSPLMGESDVVEQITNDIKKLPFILSI